MPYIVSEVFHVQSIVDEDKPNEPIFFGRGRSWLALICEVMNRPLTECKINSAVNTAFNWHSGQGSPLYGFASTRKVHDEDHRRRLLREIEHCIVTDKEKPAHPNDKTKLAVLKVVALKAEAGKELLTYERWRKLSQ